MSTRPYDLPSVWISRKNVEKWLRYDCSKFVKNDIKLMAKKWSIFLDGEKFIYQNFRRRKFHETKWKSDEKNVDTVEKNTVENNSGENNTKFLVRLTQTASEMEKLIHKYRAHSLARILGLAGLRWAE